MNMIPPITEPQPTLADMLAAISKHPKLSKTRRRDLISAVNTVARLLNRPPVELLADTRYLRQRLSRVHPMQVGMSTKRFSNVMSDLSAALKCLPKKQAIRVSQPAELPSWRAFLASLETKWQRHALVRFARYCSSRLLPPERVSDQVLEEFRSHLDQTQITKDPDRVVRIVRQAWNGFVERSGASLPVFTKPPSRRFITRPLSTYPQSFQNDLDAWLRRQTQDGVFDENAPPKPLRPITLRNIKASVRQFAHGLVESGKPVEEIRSLTDLVEFETYKDGLRYFYERNGRSTSSGLTSVATHLVTIAKYHVRVDPETLEQMRGINSRLAQPQTGLTDKNKARLAQFEDPRNVNRLIMLPEKLLKQAKSSGRYPSRAALLVMYAVAIELLLCCPIRVGNLAGLNLETHLRWYGQGRSRRLAIVIPGSEVKNGEPVEIDLPSASMRLVKAYLDNWRVLVSDNPGDWLFPARSGGRRLASHLGQEMSKVIHRETGLKMNAHLFRHLAAMLFLRIFPGEYETVRRLLGHRKLTTTTTFYAPFENKRAVRRYDEAVLSRRTRR